MELEQLVRDLLKAYDKHPWAWIGNEIHALKRYLRMHDLPVIEKPKLCKVAVGMITSGQFQRCNEVAVCQTTDGEPRCREHAKVTYD